MLDAEHKVGVKIKIIVKYLSIKDHNQKKIKKKQKFGRYVMERAKGLEPSTFSLATRRSTTELCPQINK
tara:strand:- start:146 stop:352 length:207 start_codon:yes stop_codon:yes gene_type:complete